MKQATVIISILLTLLLLLEQQATGKQNDLLLQTNKVIYVSGEFLELKCTPLKPELMNNEVLFIDVCGEGYTLEKSILSKNGASWKGKIMLNDSIQSGIYLLRAYTGTSDGRLSITSLPLTVINRFGKQEVNRQRAQTGLPFNPFYTVSNQGTALRLQAPAGKIPAGDTLSLTIKHSGEQLTSGLSLSVFKTDIEKAKNENPPFVPNEFVPGKQRIYDRLYLAGNVRDSLKQALSGELLWLSFPDSIPDIDYTYSDSSGYFRFDINHLTGAQTAIVQLADKTKKANITYEDSHLPPPAKIPLYLSAETMKSELIRLAPLRAQIHLTYRSQTTVNKQNNSDHACLLPFYGRAQKNFDPSIYIQLDSFEEIAHELLVNVRYKVRRQKTNIELWNPYQKKLFENPMILVDGVPVEAGSINQLSSTSIGTIDLQPQDRSYGELHINGLMAIHTRSGEFPLTMLPANALNIDLQAYVIEQNATPDQPFFSDVLFWEPTLKLHGESTIIEVVSSLETGCYQAIVQGIDNQGVLQRATCFFNIE